MAKSKHSAEWKIALVKQYLSGEGSYEVLAHANGISEKSLRRWVLKYREQKENGFVHGIGNKHYSKEFKEQCVKAVLSGKGSVNDIVAKYNISDENVLRRWIKCYNANMERGYFRPARTTYACDKCEKDTGFAHIITTKTPPPLMKHSLASPSTVADVMTKKYVDGVPLARQEKIWARQGVELSRATLANWVIQCTQSWLKPLYRHMKQQLLEQSVIHADETVVQVLKEDNKPATSESRMWLYASGAYSKQHIRIFEYQPDRSGKRPESFLKGFTGCLVTDGYAGYNQVQKVTHCGCWAHARRKWREAMPDGATVKTSKAAVGFQYCTKLFSLEKKNGHPDSKKRKEYRQNVVLPLLEEYFAWLKTIHPEKGSKLEDAVRYSLNQKEQLMAFLDYGDVPISNNLAENAIRPFVVGRKNWLFCDSVKGAESSAIVYSLVETAKANGIEPYEYLLLVLSMLPYLGKSPAHEELEKLMPWHPAVRHREHIRK